MTPGRLLQYFEQISEAPEAVSRLRRFILDLAVRGKLVEQEPEDKLAEELLKRIKSTRAPFEIPENWVSAKAGELLDIQYGKALSASERSVEGSVPVYGSNGVVGYCEAALTEEPAIIIGRKGSAGALNLCDGPSWITDVAYFLIPPAFFDIRFLFVVLQTLDLDHLGKGVKPGLNRTEAYQLSILVPPLAEQHRIVAKVDELMALCDELEAAQAKRERRRDRLVAATLHGMNNGDASAESGIRPTFEDSARFYFNHLPHLTTRPEHIHQLRQTILNLAVRGKLVEQDPKEEGASNLFERIQQKQQRLVRTSEIRRQQPMPSIGAEETPYIVPVRWKWVRLGDLAAEITSGSRGWAEFYSSTGAKFIRAQNIRFGYLELNAIAHVELPAPVEGKRTSARKGDLMIVITGSGVTNPGMLDQDIGEAYVSQHVGLVSPVERATSRWLLTCLMATTACRGELIEKAYGAGRPGLNLDTIRMLRVPLPPLAEQSRIVAKVDELMALCDELESRLTTTATTRRRLLESTLAEAISAF